MKLPELQRHYDNLYKTILFERTGLFECLNDAFKPSSVIYVGSSIHVTPSFVFRNVTYLDKSDFAREFFADGDALLEFVSARKRYRQKPFIRFIHRDWAEKPPETDGKYDMAISLFALNTPDVLIEYVGHGGIMVFLPLSDDRRLPLSENLDNRGHVSFSRSKYIYHERPNDRVPGTKRKKFMKNDVYVEENTYDVYAKR